MNAFILRELCEKTLPALYSLRMQADFPSNERPNLPALCRHVREGLQRVYLLEQAGEPVAYAVVAEASGVALVTMLAVYPERRGDGVGSEMVMQLMARYRHLRGLLFEVEDPMKAPDEASRRTREKRNAFYERLGCRFATGVDHCGFGVPLLLYLLPIADSYNALNASAVSDLTAVYDRIVPEDLRHRVWTRHAT